LKRKDINEHWNICENTLLTCTNVDCTDTFMRKDQVEHDRICFHLLIPCKYCARKVKRGELEKHYLICDEMEVDCMFNCGVRFPRKVKNHSDTCVEEMVKCVALDIGCDFVDRRKYTNDHEKNCALVKIRFYVQSLQTQHQALKSEHQTQIQNLQTQLRTSQNQIQSLQTQLQNQIQSLQT